jgi:hypothetical protein
MNKIIVICNVPHIIEPGICALCERDKAEMQLSDLQAQLDEANGKGKFVIEKRNPRIVIMGRGELPKSGR